MFRRKTLSRLAEKDRTGMKSSIQAIPRLKFQIRDRPGIAAAAVVENGWISQAGAGIFKHSNIRAHDATFFDFAAVVDQHGILTNLSLFVFIVLT